MTVLGRGLVFQPGQPKEREKESWGGGAGMGGGGGGGKSLKLRTTDSFPYDDGH